MPVDESFLFRRMGMAMDASGEEDDFSSGDHSQGTTNDDHLHRLDHLCIDEYKSRRQIELY
jgi:hypothetical protein